MTDRPDYEYVELPHDRFELGGNVRPVVEDEDFRLLVESLRQHGQLTPGTACWDDPHERACLISGHRRFQASQAAGLDRFKALTYDRPLDAEELIVLQLTENLHRKGLTPLEEGRAYLALLGAVGGSARKLAKRLAVAHTTITRAIALSGLPEDLQERIEAGTLAPAHARAIARLGDPDEMRRIAAEAEALALTAEQVETLVSEQLRPRKKSHRTKRTPRRSYTLKPGLTAVVEGTRLHIRGKGVTPRSRANGEWIPVLEALLEVLRAELSLTSGARHPESEGEPARDPA
jgi:ParB family chromosome partitioning protein